MPTKQTENINSRSNGNAFIKNVKTYWFDFLLVLPTLLFLAVLLWIPFLRGVWMSFHRWTVLNHQWVGLYNYIYLFHWDMFYTSIRTTVLYSLITFFQLIVALVAALAVNRLNKFDNIISGVFLAGYTVPAVVSGAIWVYLLNPSLGPIFGYLKKFGIISHSIYWGVDGQSAMAVIMGVGIWTFWPFMFLILLANIENIPTYYYESAKVYGASTWQSFIKVTLPQLKSAFLVVISIRIIWNISKISQPLQITNGGPASQTSLLAVLMYKYTYKYSRFGLAYSVGVVLLLISIIFVFVFLREYRRESSEVQL